MSTSRKSLTRPFFLCGLVLLIACGGIAACWKARVLPQGLQSGFDDLAVLISPGPVPAGQAPVPVVVGARAKAAQEKAEREMHEAGEQFEPPVAEQSRQTPRTGELAPAQEEIDEADPLAGEGSRQRSRVRQAGFEAEEEPSNDPPLQSDGSARGEIDDPAESQPVAAARADKSKPKAAKPPGKVPAPEPDPFDALKADFTEKSAAKPAPAARPADRIALSTSEPPAAKDGALMDMKAIASLIEADDYLTAQRELSRWYWKKPASRGKIRKQLEDMAQALYFSPQPLFHEPYVVQAGDQLRVIAQRYHLSWEYLSKLNNVDARKIRMGQKLKVVDGPFSAIVSLGSYELIVHLNGSFVRSYRVGVGKEGTTPLGTFTVKNKLIDPTYYGPDGVVLAADDPNNPLGERWIDIGDSYGIHGTIEPDSIGKNESRGCIRMLAQDVEEAYNLLVIGSQVRVQK